MVLAELQDRRLFNEMLFSSYEGVSEDRLLALAEEAFDKVMKPRSSQARRTRERASTRATTSSSSRARSTS
jgi:hypothetical protein